jgi:hypothetical protein
VRWATRFKSKRPSTSAISMSHQLRTNWCLLSDMRRVTLALILVLLTLTPLVAQTAKGKSNDTQMHPASNVPRTVDEAVSILKTRWLSPKDLDWLLRNPQKQAVATLYRPFGTGVRNQFGLWGENQQLRDSCGENNPEGCSVVIFNRLWESVRSDADPSLVRQLDCQFQLAEAIHINYKGFHNLTIGALHKALQSQIDDQMAKFEATGQPPCQSSLVIELEGKPDKHCFVDASLARHHKGQPKDQPTETSLEMILGGLGVRNFFTARHLPPKIVLNFTRQCQFSNPPPSY